MSIFKQVYGFGEIKKLDKQIIQAMKVIEEILSPLIQDGKKEDALYQRLLRYSDKVLKLGFEECHSTGLTFLGNRQVIKFAYYVKNIPPDRKHRIPTMIYNFEDTMKGYDFLLTIQPRAKVILVDTDDEVPEYLESYTDSHNENICLYGGKYLLLDW